MTNFRAWVRKGELFKFRAGQGTYMLFGEANVGSDCIYLRKVFLGPSNT